MTIERRKSLCGTASLITGLSSISLFSVLQLRRFAISDFRLAITITMAVLVLLLAGVILGCFGRGTLRGPGVVSCAVGLLFWLVMTIGVLL